VDRTPEIMQALEERGLLANKRFSIYATPRHAWHVGQALPMYPNMAHHQLKEKIDTWASSCSCAGGQMKTISPAGDLIEKTGACSSGCSCTSRQMKQVGVGDDRVTEKLRKYLRGGIAELSTTVEFCSANTGGMHILDPFGAMYACWDTVGRVSEKIGTYSMEGPVYNQRADDWKDRCPGDIPQCSNCKYVMFHFGGCAGLPVETGLGLLHPACYAFPDMFELQARKFFAAGKFRELLPPASHAPVDTPMDLAVPTS
jgi:radical SAM protein with 4Fe4S-binding SPASM domain